MTGSNWTGRAPRSMAQAFGPHCSTQLDVPRICIFQRVAVWLRSIWSN